ncbi:hypothetical protein [Methylobacterium sp. sgz302541]|uniref:hypothetical protein n=1 Tax=unclassified Methylobacterium TaxID=2615210 RepID=UPI003D336500
MIGGGVRLSSIAVAVFETVVDAIRKAAPETPIAFNTRPDDTAEAALRRLPAG